MPKREKKENVRETENSVCHRARMGLRWKWGEMIEFNWGNWWQENNIGLGMDVETLYDLNPTITNFNFVFHSNLIN